MGASTTFDTKKKKKNWRLDLPRGLRNKFLSPFESKYEYCIFLYDLFSYYGMFFPLFTMQALFRNILPHRTPSNPNDIFYWFSSVDNRPMQIELTAALLKRHKDIKRLKYRSFSGSYQRNGMPSAKHLRQSRERIFWT